MDHEAKGAISSQVGWPATPGIKKAVATVNRGYLEAEVARVAAMTPAEVVAASKERRKKITAARKAAKKSTAARKDVRTRGAEERRSDAAFGDVHDSSQKLTPKRGSQPAAGHATLGEDVPAGLATGNLSAGTQAPPVDTPKRGRPKTTTAEQRRAYKALKAKEARAKKKAAT